MGKQKQRKLKSILPFLLQIGIGAAIGAVFGISIGFIGAGEEESSMIFFIGLISLFLSFFIHMILHEGGHLVCGLLSGYKFVSFRIGSIIWIKRDGKFLRKRFSIPGTGGQCLLDPPGFGADGTFPCLFYNLGGGLSNFLFAVLAAGAAFVADSVIWQVILMPFALVGVYLGAVNLIPLKAGGIANDGYNIKAFKAHPESARALWIQLKVNKLQSDGVRLSEMPGEFFEIPEGTEEGDPLIDAIKVLRFQRVMDEKDFDRARDIGKKLEHEPKLMGLFKNIIKVDLLYLELIGQCRTEEVEKLYSKEQQKYLKMVKGYPSTWRVKYAYAVHFAHDEKAADDARRNFDKVVENYPMEGEIFTEKELIEEVRER